MSPRKPRVYEQGTSIYVIGTGDTQEALRLAGITPETHHWSGTGFGSFVRRQREWRPASSEMPPKDARPGVCFIGPIRAKEST